jgi:hypothetical protein
MSNVDKVTLKDSEISDLDEYYTQIEIARPLLFYERAAQEALVSAKTWDNNRKYQIGEGLSEFGSSEYNMSDYVSKAILDVGFHLIFSHSAVEYLLGIGVVNESNISAEEILPGDSGQGSPMNSINGEDKARILEMSGYDIKNELDNYRTLRNKLAHDFRIGEDFFGSDSHEITKDVQSAYETVTEVCELVYDIPFSSVIQEIHGCFNPPVIEDTEDLEDKPTGSLVSHLQNESQDPEDSTEVTRIKKELERRGYKTNYTEIEKHDYKPHTDKDLPGLESRLVHLGNVESDRAIFSETETTVSLDFLSYVDKSRGLVPYEWQATVTIEDTKVKTKSSTQFNHETDTEKFHSTTINLEVGDLPPYPKFTVEVFVMVKTERGYSFDVWKNELINGDWIMYQLGNAYGILVPVKKLIEDDVIPMEDSIEIEIQSLLTRTAVTLLRLNKSTSLLSDTYAPEIPTFGEDEDLHEVAERLMKSHDKMKEEIDDTPLSLSEEYINSFTPFS